MGLVVDSYRFAAGGAWSPADLAGLKMWYDFSDTSTITDTSGLVDSVTDKSGNGYTLTSTSSDRPTTAATSQNGLNVLDFANDRLIASTASDWIWMHDGVDVIGVFCAFKFSSGSNSTLLATTRVATTNTGFSMLLASTGVNLYHYTDNGSTFVVVNNRSAFSGRTTSANLGVIIADHSASAADRSRLRANGSAVAGDNAQSNSPSGSNPYRAFAIGKSDGSNYTGSIFEVFGCVNPTVDEISDAEDYLIDKWGIT